MNIALIGNQNSGKTSLFNILTGTNQKVGNWPGVTIAKKSGRIKRTGDTINDLPGIYSLSPYSLEEGISRDFLLGEKIDLIINIIDVNNLERSLYLTTQLRELNIDMIVALNMADLLEKAGQTLDVKVLEEKLQASVVLISARKRKGIDELITMINGHTYLKNKDLRLNVFPKNMADLMEKIAQKEEINQFESVLVFAQDPGYLPKLAPYLAQIKRIEEKEKSDTEELVASFRYRFVEMVLAAALQTNSASRQWSTGPDRILLNKWACFPIFILVMMLIYFVAIGLMGTIPLQFIKALFNGCENLTFNFTFIGVPQEVFNVVIPFRFAGLGPLIGQALLGDALGASTWAVSLVRDGIIGGLGSIIAFLPQLAVLFFLLALLETSGYMSRVAFALDRVFRYFGLNGKSIISFIIGSGCSVPGIMSTKTIEDVKERKIAAITTSFIPCGAKLPIIAIFVTAFFPGFNWLMTLALYLFALVIIMAVSIFLNKVVWRKAPTTSSYINELPVFRAPIMRFVFRDCAYRLWDFIKKAGTIILLCSLVVWFLASFTWSFQYIDSESVYTIEDSMLAGLGKAFAWLFYPMLGGQYSWGASVSAIQGLIAKEQVVSSMEIIAGLSAGGGTIFSGTSQFAFFNGWSAFAFMTFCLFSSPCFAALGAMRQELASRKDFAKAILIQNSFAWVLASLIGLIGWGVSAIWG